jgi:hypothetical protein
MCFFQKCESICLFSTLRYQIDLSGASHCSSTCYSGNRRRTLKISMAQGWSYTVTEHRITLRQFLQSPILLPLSVETGKEQRQSRAEFYSVLPRVSDVTSHVSTKLLPKQTTQTRLLHYKSNSGSAELRYMISNTVPCSDST